MPKQHLSPLPNQGAFSCSASKKSLKKVLTYSLCAKSQAPAISINNKPEQMENT